MKLLWTLLLVGSFSLGLTACATGPTRRPETTTSGLCAAEVVYLIRTYQLRAGSDPFGVVAEAAANGYDATDEVVLPIRQYPTTDEADATKALGRMKVVAPRAYEALCLAANSP